jgi:hypothetical protein
MRARTPQSDAMPLDKRGIAPPPQLAFYCDTPPRGLKLGAVLRWRNPRFHQ